MVHNEEAQVASEGNTRCTAHKGCRRRARSLAQESKPLFMITRGSAAHSQKVSYDSAHKRKIHHVLPVPVLHCAVIHGSAARSSHSPPWRSAFSRTNVQSGVVCRLCMQWYKQAVRYRVVNSHRLISSSPRERESKIEAMSAKCCCQWSLCSWVQESCPPYMECVQSARNNIGLERCGCIAKKGSNQTRAKNVEERLREYAPD
eukprot:scaffold120369_cov35-Tisochrysis_lutea.AAC.2